MNSTVSFFSLALLIVQTPSAFAEKPSKQVATLTQIQGKTEIFTNPSKKAHDDKSLKEGTMALYEGSYYMVQDAKVGDRVLKDNIIRTLPGGQARVVYDNGDQFSLGSGTAYKITWNEKTDLDAKMDMMYGRLRGVIAKEGPLEKIKIKTRAATMGVRGTDFFIADTGKNGETEITVIRGSVEVTPNPDAESKVKKTELKKVELKTGYSATVEEQTVETRSTTREDLGGIQKSSVITETEKAEKPEVAAKVAKLEEKAVEVTKKDIKIYQPDLYKRIVEKAKEMTSAQELSAQVVEMVAAVAPAAPKKRKPTITELKDTEQGDVYDKYFKIGE